MKTKEPKPVKLPPGLYRISGIHGGIHEMVVESFIGLDIVPVRMWNWVQRWKKPFKFSAATEKYIKRTHKSNR